MIGGVNHNEVLYVKRAKREKAFIKYEQLGTVKSSSTSRCHVIRCSVALSAIYLEAMFFIEFEHVESFILIC